MKKLVSLILAVLMLLSVFAMAEANTGATEGIQSDAEEISAKKIHDQEQEIARHDGDQGGVVHFAAPDDRMSVRSRLMRPPVVSREVALARLVRSFVTTEIKP